MIAALLLTQGLAWPELSQAGRAGTSAYIDLTVLPASIRALILDGCVVVGRAAWWRLVLRMEGKRRGGVAIEGNLGHHL